MPPSVCLTWNQVSPFRVIPNSPTKSWALFRRPTSFPSCGRDRAAAGRGALQKRVHREEGGVQSAESRGEPRANRGASWSAVEIPQIPAAGMPGDDFFTRGQMCLSLLQTSRPRRRRPRVKALHSSALRGWRPLSSYFADPTQTAGKSSPNPRPSPRPLCGSCSRHGCAKSGPSSRPRALRRPVITRPGTAPMAPGGHSRSGLLQPSPSLLSSPQLLPRLPRHSSLPTSRGVSAELRATGCNVRPAKPRAKE